MRDLCHSARNSSKTWSVQCLWLCVHYKELLKSLTDRLTDAINQSINQSTYRAIKIPRCWTNVWEFGLTLSQHWGEFPCSVWARNIETFYMPWFETAGGNLWYSCSPGCAGGVEGSRSTRPRTRDDLHGGREETSKHNQRWPDVVFMLWQRRRRWPNIKTTSS